MYRFPWRKLKMSFEAEKLTQYILVTTTSIYLSTAWFSDSQNSFFLAAWTESATEIGRFISRWCINTWLLSRLLQCTSTKLNWTTRTFLQSKCRRFQFHKTAWRIHMPKIRSIKVHTSFYQMMVLVLMMVYACFDQ